MNKPIRIFDLSDTLHLAEYPETSGHHGFWLYDDTREINLSMRAKTPQDALLEAVGYYQRRCAELEAERALLRNKADAVRALYANLEDELEEVR